MVVDEKNVRDGWKLLCLSAANRMFTVEGGFSALPSGEHIEEACSTIACISGRGRAVRLVEDNYFTSTKDVD